MYSTNDVKNIVSKKIGHWSYLCWNTVHMAAVDHNPILNGHIRPKKS